MKLFPIFIGLILFIVIISIFKVSCERVEESWTNYEPISYGNYHPVPQNVNLG